MKKIFCILSILTIVSPAVATVDLPEYDNSYKQGVATAAYVKGAYYTMDVLKENKLNTVAANKQNKENGDIFHSDSSELAGGKFVTSVTASNGIVTVTRNEVTIPIGEPSGTTPSGRAPLWIE